MAEADLPEPCLDVMRNGGVVRVGVADVAGVDLEMWGADSDRMVLTLDTQDCASEADLVRTLGAAFDLDEDDDPDWDAIDDCLADYDVSPAGGLVIVWTGWDGLDEEDVDEVVPTAVDALATAAQYWVDEGRPWAVLVVGDGPSWQLPWAGAGAPPWEDSDDEDEWDDDEESDDSRGWGSDDDADDMADEIADESYTFDDGPVTDPAKSW